jgi:hypothetical protein
VRAWEDPSERQHLKYLLTAALAASQRGFVEQRLMTALSAIEYLSWVDQVLQAKMDESDWRKKSAHWRVRQLLTTASIPLIVSDTRTPKLATFARNHQMDGPAALCAVRDAVTHPKDRTACTGMAVLSLRLLGSRVVTLTYLFCIALDTSVTPGIEPRSRVGRARLIRFRGLQLGRSELNI